MDAGLVFGCCLSTKRNMIRKKRKTYHHGNLAESLLDAVDSIAVKFGMEAVTLRACAKLVGVSPSSAFRHYSDKRDLMTAFAVRALEQLTHSLNQAGDKAEVAGSEPFLAVGMAYVQFAVEKPALFRAMWNEETLYMGKEEYQVASAELAACLQAGFASSLEDADPTDLSVEETLAWSTVHGLANLLIDGMVDQKLSKKKKMEKCESVLMTLAPVFR